jgi:hypothetical protein
MFLKPLTKETTGTKDELVFLRLLRVKHTTLFFQFLALVSWVYFSLTAQVFSPLAVVVNSSTFALASIALLVYGSVIRRARFFSWAFIIPLASIFFLPYSYLQPWLGQGAVAILIVFAILLVGRSQPWPDQNTLLLPRVIILTALYGIIGLGLWLAVTFLSSTIYPVRDAVVETLVSQGAKMLNSEVQEVILRSEVNLSGRYYTFEADGALVLYSGQGLQLMNGDDPLKCAPPYPVVPSGQDVSGWVCRSITNHWMFFHDFERSIHLLP